MLGFRFCAWAFSSCGERGPLFIAVRGLSLLRPLLLRSTSSGRTGSVVVAHGPSCSEACGIFPDQGSNPCSLHWQADSQPLCHQGSPKNCFLISHTTNIYSSYYSQSTVLDSQNITVNIRDTSPILMEFTVGASVC